jgi:hypothetical protein
MRYVKVFEAWTEEMEEEVSHQELYEMLEKLVDAWKEWKENEDEDRDEEELHDEFMRKVENLVEKAKEIVEPEEEEEEETEDSGSEESESTGEESSETEEVEEVEEVEEGRIDLSGKTGSLANLLEPLISVMDTMTFPELQNEFMDILKSSNLKASTMTRNKWMQKVMEIRTKPHLMNTIKNIYLRGSGLGSNVKDYD